LLQIVRKMEGNVLPNIAILLTFEKNTAESFALSAFLFIFALEVNIEDYEHSNKTTVYPCTGGTVERNG